MALLEVKDLTAAYGGIQALRGVSLKVEEGQIVAVLGANGAGKSTLLKCISSVMKPTGGTIEFLGQPVSQKPYEVVEAGLVQVPEARQIFAKLTVAENLRVGSGLRKDTDGIRRDLERVYTMFPRLKEREKQYGGLLSGGEQQMLAIGRGIMAKPKLMMLDEPSLGLAPVIVTQVFDIIKEINQEGMASCSLSRTLRKFWSSAIRLTSCKWVRWPFPARAGICWRITLWRRPIWATKGIEPRKDEYIWRQKKPQGFLCWALRCAEVHWKWCTGQHPGIWAVPCLCASSLLYCISTKCVWIPPTLVILTVTALY